MCKKILDIIIFSLCFVSIILVITFTSIYKIIIVNGNSMAPTLSSGQIILTNKNTDDINYSDIVVFHLNDKQNSDEIVIKRVIAMSGDRITVKNGVLSVNNLVYSKYHCKQIQEFVLKDNEVFVVGDNADESFDSREFGVISIDDIISVKHT